MYMYICIYIYIYIYTPIYVGLLVDALHGRDLLVGQDALEIVRPYIKGNPV